MACMAARCGQLVAAAALRLCDDALHQRCADLTTAIVGIDEHVLHEAERTRVEIVRHHVQVGSANNLALEGTGDLHAIRGHADGLEGHARLLRYDSSLRQSACAAAPSHGAARRLAESGMGAENGGGPIRVEIEKWGILPVGC